VFVKKVIVGGIVAAALSISGLAGGIASAAEEINIGVGELQECSISKSMDGDGDVDGRDFLVWQRSSSASSQGVSSGDLADWQANYGAGY
jgi:hypothetical protein